MTTALHQQVEKKQKKLKQQDSEFICKNISLYFKNFDIKLFLVGQKPDLCILEFN